MTSEPDDIADFELCTVDAEGIEELAAASSGPRAEALAEILHYWSQFRAEERRLYEVTRIRVDLSQLTDPSPIILPGDMQ